MNESDEISTSSRQTGERKKSNLAFAFFCLEKSRVKDMEVFYAFCRLMDDIADEEGRDPATKRRELQAWKKEIAELYEGSRELSPLAQEMADVIARRKIPQEYIQAIIDGVMRDTFDEPFIEFEDIRKYCYGVASAVGLASIYIFGFKNERTKEYAEALGYALQFTNILRDVVYDMRTQSRCYIPRKELEFFGLAEKDLQNPADNPRCKELFRMLHFRAKHFFRKADRLLPPEDRAAMKPAFIMRAIYENILDRIAQSGFAITEKPVKLRKWQKIKLAYYAIRRANEKYEPPHNFGKVCVVGGGLAGMCAALKLARDGFDPEIFEARATLGGRAAAIDWQGARLDNGSHATMGCYRNLFGFMEMLGESVETNFSRTKAMDFIFGDGRKFHVPFPKRNASWLKKLFSFLSYRRIPGVGEIANLRLLAKIRLQLVNPQADKTAATFLKENGIGETAIEAFWEPFCVSALNTTCQEASARVMCDTIRKSVLGGGEKGVLYFPKAATIDALLPKAQMYLQSVGAKINLSENVEKIIIANGEFIGIATPKSGEKKFDHCVCTLPAKQFAKMLPADSALRARVESIKGTDILNIYFVTDKKLIEGSYACLVGSPLHWIFDHTAKSQKCKDSGEFLYGVTTSHARMPFEAAGIKTMLETEITRLFGKCEILKILPAHFADATISADCASESKRPDDEHCGISKLHICGDWVATDLPCTMESAAKSVNDMTIFD